MGYVVAAYAIGIGSVVAYAVWIQLQRRALMRREAEARGGAAARRAPGGP